VTSEKLVFYEFDVTVLKIPLKIIAYIHLKAFKGVS